MPLWSLFISFFKIGLFAIGGAYSFLPLLERELVDKYHWLTKEEFLDVLGMANLFPGAISIKYATYTGYKIAGVPGIIVTNIGNIMVPAVLIIFASTIYTRYKDLPSIKGAFNMIQLAVFSMVIVAAFHLINFNQLTNIKGFLIAAGCFVLFAFTKIHPALIIITAGILGAFLK